MKDPLLPNTVRQKDEKPQAGLKDAAIPYVKIKITEIPFEKSSIPQKCTVNAHVPLYEGLSIIFQKILDEIWRIIYNCSLHHIFESELQKIVGNLIDELRKLYINETVI